MLDELAVSFFVEEPESLFDSDEEPESPFEPDDESESELDDESLPFALATDFEARLSVL